MCIEQISSIPALYVVTGSLSIIYILSCKYVDEFEFFPFWQLISLFCIWQIYNTFNKYEYHARWIYFKIRYSFILMICNYLKHHFK